MVGDSPHVSAKQILRWIIPFYRSGVKEVGGIRLDLHPYQTPMGGFLTFMLSLEAGPHAVVVLHGECREDLAGPIQINGYQPGLWTADLYRAAIMNFDDPEDEA
jgi:hypothetical protein